MRIFLPVFKFYIYLVRNLTKANDFFHPHSNHPPKFSSNECLEQHLTQPLFFCLKWFHVAAQNTEFNLKGGNRILASANCWCQERKCLLLKDPKGNLWIPSVAQRSIYILMPLSTRVNKFQRLGKISTWALKASKDFLGWTENKDRKPALKKKKKSSIQSFSLTLKWGDTHIYWI